MSVQAQLLLALHWLLPSLAGVLLVYAAAHDVAARTIPDAVPVALAAFGLAARLAAGNLLPATGAMALLGAACGYCWWRGWLGGGDLKLLIALALLLPPHRLLAAVVTTGWSGAVVALPYCLLRRHLAPPAPRRPARLLPRIWRAERFRLRRGGPLPYGVAIAAGGLLGLFGP